MNYTGLAQCRVNRPDPAKLVDPKTRFHLYRTVGALLIVFQRGCFE